MARVLIVEDELIIALDLEMALEEAGHVVVGVADTADGAVAMAEAHAPDAMVVDLRLADGSSGPEAVERVRAAREVAVVFASGNLDPATREALDRFEPLALIPKPFAARQVADALVGMG